MSSQTAQEEERSRFIQSLFNSTNTDNSNGVSFFLPFLLGLNQEPQNQIILVNPLTQNMVVISTNNNTLDDFKKGQPPASKASIESLPVVEIDANVEEQCVVCLEEWKDEEKGVEMPCKHKFHKECVGKWLSIHGSCPVCRYQMPVDDQKTNHHDHDVDQSRRDNWVWLTLAGRRRTSDD